MMTRGNQSVRALPTTLVVKQTSEATVVCQDGAGAPLQERVRKGLDSFLSPLPPPLSPSCGSRAERRYNRTSNVFLPSFLPPRSHGRQRRRQPGGAMPSAWASRLAINTWVAKNHPPTTEAPIDKTRHTQRKRKKRQRKNKKIKQHQARVDSRYDEPTKNQGSRPK